MVAQDIQRDIEQKEEYYYRNLLFLHANFFLKNCYRYLKTAPIIL